MCEARGSKFYGKYRGVVVDNRDPTWRGRLQVKVPAVMGEQAVWALPCTPYAGREVGFFALPEVDVGVWVEFEAGDPSYPIWVGCFWADGAIPPADAVPEVKFLKTEKATLRIDDRSGEITIENVTGSMIQLTALGITQDSKTITLKVGVKKLVLNPASLDVHDGAFTVV